MKNALSVRSNFLVLSFLLLWILAPIGSVLAKAPDSKKGPVKCTMDFSLKSWSAFYKSAKGEGVISCSNGQKSAVKLRGHGGGITFGKYNLPDGIGTFTPVGKIQDLYGKYAEVGGEAGAGKAAMGHALSKDDITLNIKGKGTGGGFGFDFSGFSITPVKK